MSVLDRLQAKFGRFAVPHLTKAFMLVWTLTFLAEFVLHDPAQGRFSDMLRLDPAKVVAGEWWRVLSFMLMPPSYSALWFIIAMMVYWLIGNALEAQWGAFRYNVYILLGWIFTITGAFVVFGFAPPGGQGIGVMDNAYLFATLFLAFATLFPNFEFLLFFILPVKVKWLALIMVAALIYGIAIGSWMDRALILLSVLNYLLFFGVHLHRLIAGKGRRVQQAVKTAREDAVPFHRCAACGVTEKQDPERSFRVCGICKPPREYCDLHIKDHEHIIEETVER